MFCEQFEAFHLQWWLFVANLAKFDHTQLLEQSDHMRKLSNVNPFPVSRMYYEPIPPFTPFFIFSGKQEKKS
jgi:hypothetical protein